MTCAGVPQDAQRLGITIGEQAEVDGLRDVGHFLERAGRVDDRAVGLGREDGLGQAGADAFGDVEAGAVVGEFFERTVRQAHGDHAKGHSGAASTSVTRGKSLVVDDFRRGTARNRIESALELGRAIRRHEWRTAGIRGIPLYSSGADAASTEGRAEAMRHRATRNGRRRFSFRGPATMRHRAVGRRDQEARLSSRGCGPARCGPRRRRGREPGRFGVGGRLRRAAPGRGG